MQRPGGGRQKRPYWTGKAPDWAAGEDEGAAALVAAQSTAAAPAALPAAALMGPAAAADPRLLRLTQRDSAAAGRRGTSEAVVVRRRLRSPSMEAGVPPERGREHEQARQSPQREMQPLPGDDEDEEDEEAIAARRLAIRARQLVAAADAAGAAVGGEEGSDDSSEYTTDDDSDSDQGPVLLKPAFVPKTDRETLAAREAALAQAEQTTRQQAEQLEDRRRQTQELVAQAQLQEAQQEAPPQDSGDFDTGDEADEVAQYEAWRERELHRIARDRQLRQAGAKAEAPAAAPGVDLQAALPPPKKKWKFLQKYWHKGAFFQGEDEDGEAVLGDIMRRDYDAPTGEDKFDRQMLPKVMQVRNFGRRGRTKWTHLLAEDTSMQAADPANPAASRLPRERQPQDVFDKPRTTRT